MDSAKAQLAHLSAAELAGAIRVLSREWDSKGQDANAALLAGAVLQAELIRRTTLLAKAH